ncbi:hypothetical protein AC477_04145 [miscellaneous Crenarchaeota group-1 archaeon SG8-32-1]|uniref:Uncharacterized protein n=1 Tax=miscellaneous Crenarchaeota group-1 archaeon SG8-32-1 TaxID=1685124 RepID=A0A0M0BS68_9ARCH|nr:MAG: hypothetical protein AC477_04145 [miscellaneous Crenarchaeota group-1 archaeon SG8-32-1]
MNKPDASILLMIIGGLMIASALFFMTQKEPPNKVWQVKMTILDEGPDQDQSFQTQYEEKNPATIYRDKTVNWIEVGKEEQTIGFMETSEITVMDVAFTDTVGNGSGDDLIVVYFTNSGTGKVTIAQVNFNGVIQTGNWELTSGEDIIGPGSLDTMQINADWTAGNNYSITFSTTDGTMIGSFTSTA